MSFIYTFSIEIYINVNQGLQKKIQVHSQVISL